MDVEKKELSLLLDCPIRWSSLEVMVERFLRVIDPVQKALMDLNMGNIWTLEDTNTAKCILNTLSPVKYSVEALSRKDANLLTGEGVLKFLFNALQMDNSALSKKLLDELKVQLLKRRNIQTVSLLKFLQDPNNLQERDDEFFNSTSKSNIIKVAKTYMHRLFVDSNQLDLEHNDNSDFEFDSDPDVPVAVESNSATTTTPLRQKLEESIQASLKESQPVANNFYTLTKEFNLFEVTGKLTTNLENLKLALTTIRPTSTQNERNFSTSGHFVSKKRNRLKDSSIDCLCFLKHYFMKNNI